MANFHSEWYKKLSLVFDEWTSKKKFGKNELHCQKLHLSFSLLTSKMMQREFVEEEMHFEAQVREW